MTKKFEIRNSTVEFLTFVAEGEEQGVQVLYKNETIWATQKAMAMLFDCSTDNIGLHLKNIFKSGELEESSVTEKNSATATDGKNYMTKFYNLDAIISVGYRVNSIRATQFRQWCTYVIRQFSLRGYIIDKKRMENGSFIGEDYFEHLLAEIREIRLSERRFYQKLMDIYATAVDYNKDAPTTRFLAERMANRHIPMTMEDWAKRIDIILEVGGDAVLYDAGKVTAEFAKSFAESEFEKYRVIQDKLFSSDFDKLNSLPFDDDEN